MAHCLYPSVRRKEGKPWRNPLGIQLMILEKLILYSTGQKQQVLVATSVSVPQLGTNLFCTLLFYINTLKIMLLHVIIFQKHANLKGKQKICPFLTRCICLDVCIYFSPVKMIIYAYIIYVHFHYIGIVETVRIQDFVT